MPTWTSLPNAGYPGIYPLRKSRVGHLVDEPRVLGAVNFPGLRGMIEDAGGVVGREGRTRRDSGAAGLLLGLGVSRSMR